MWAKSTGAYTSGQLTMADTPLADSGDRFLSLGPRADEKSGDQSAENAEVQSKAAFQSLALVLGSGREALRLTGKDRLTLLHNISTQNLRNLEEGSAAQCAFLDLRGKIQGIADVIHRSSETLLVVGPGQAEPLATRIDKRIIMEDVVVGPTEWTTVQVIGPRAQAFVESLLGEPLPEVGRSLELSSRGWDSVARVRADLGVELLMAPDSDGILRNALEAALPEGALSVGPEVLNRWRVVQGVSEYGRDFSDDHLPHEAGIVEAAVSFHKGCYIGQEIVAKVESRGRVNRFLRSMTLVGGGGDEPRAGTELHVDGEPVGVLTSVAMHPLTARVHALGWVRRAHLAAELCWGDSGRARLI